MPKQPVSIPIWGHLAKHTDLKPKFWNYGTTHDKDKVMFMGMYHRSDTGEFPPYGTEYELKLDSGVRTTFMGLGDDTCPTVFFTQEKKFDDFCVESGLFKKIEELKKTKIPVRLNVDACHNHSRATQDSTLTYSVRGEMVGTNTMDESSSCILNAQQKLKLLSFRILNSTSSLVPVHRFSTVSEVPIPHFS